MKIKLILTIIAIIVIMFKTHSQSAETFIDARDGKTYKTVKIKKQIWMAENLNYKTGNSWCYDNKSNNCEKSGVLYDWNAAQKACPAGWRLPSKKDYKKLMKNVGGKANAYHALEIDGSSGFNALLSGLRKEASSWENVTDKFDWNNLKGFYWTSTEKNDYRAWRLELSGIRDGVDLYDDYKILGFSVRCIKE